MSSFKVLRSAHRRKWYLHVRFPRGLKAGPNSIMCLSFVVKAVLWFISPHTHSQTLSSLYGSVDSGYCIFFTRIFVWKKVLNLDRYMYKCIWNVFTFFLIWEVTNIKIYWCAFFFGTVNNYLYCSACTWLFEMFA